MNSLTKSQWVDEVFRLLCLSQGEPANDTERGNLRSWAESMYDGQLEAADGVETEIYSPNDAHNDELFYGA